MTSNYDKKGIQKMNQLITITQNENNDQVVSGRETTRIFRS